MFLKALIVCISFLIQHPKWNADGSLGFPNDIALIRLERAAPVDATTVVSAKLPASHPMDYTDKECWISGWGRISSECKQYVNDV